MGHKWVDIVFDGPPGPEAGRFVEVEDMHGTSIQFGEWIQRDDGYWVLRLATAGYARLAEDNARLTAELNTERAAHAQTTAELAAERERVCETCQRTRLACEGASRSWEYCDHLSVSCEATGGGCRAWRREGI